MHVLYETIDRKHNDAGALQYIKETPTKFYLSLLSPGHVRKVTFYNREMITSCFISFLHFLQCCSMSHQLKTILNSSHVH